MAAISILHARARATAPDLEPGTCDVSSRLPGFLAPLLMALLAACAAPGPEASGTAASPLAGRAFDVGAGEFIAPDPLLRSLERADFVLLGERHGNPEHHWLQAHLVGELQARWEDPAPVAFEMIGTDQQLALTEHLQAEPEDIAGLATVLDWAASGWPDWALYAPIVQAAADADAQIVAANLPRAEVRAVFDRGPAELDQALLRRTGLERPLPEPLAADLRDELQRAHCGETPPEMVEGMFRVQRTRDAIMADRLAALAGAGHGILIAGAGHVRTDRGVPWYLQRLRPGARIASLAFVEVEGTTTEPPDDLPYDYLWFTPPAGRDDPCAGTAAGRNG